jgi:C4-dicarboxylate-specific signal transduction histidine kinase
LRQAHEELEIKVAERTTELADTSKALQAEVAARRRSIEISGKTVKKAKRGRTKHEKG